MTPIRLMLVDDHMVVREGLRTVLEQQEEFQVVAEAADGNAAVEAYRRHRPDILLVDLRLPGMDGPEVIRAVRELDAQARCIVLSSFDARADVERALAAGARGYLVKAAGAQELMTAIRRVHHGLRAVEPRLQERVRRISAATFLTPRELDVLRHVVAGLRNHQIAKAMLVSVSTVKFHLQHILEKLDAHDRTEAAVIAVRDGLVPALH
ncbi:response regulator [Tahibacter amnicola]|uniref:Response regulator transcription factor n=1 Tax=Tahibacter amnicola TaxID=2976241 RepID=A0ABY6BBW2_9GAMM|nr:response regulator transcription factor [Tahibacter amnicola]UXI67051.1 response regulator transcription factor [Tahibacter amnicola]